MTKIVLFTTMFGAMVGYLIIIGDLLTPVICEWSGHASDCSVDLFYLNRNFLISLTIVTVILPLAFFSKMHQLERSSVLAVASVMCLIVVVLWRSIEHVANEGKDFEFPKLFNFSILGFAQALPIIAFALGKKYF
jgi:amino acid permease